MRQVLLCVSLLLLGLTWTVAQSSGSSDSSGAAGSAQSAASGQMGQSGGSGDHMTVQGCLSGSNGNYTLTDKNGNSYQLTGDTAKLSEHVGHEVKVMGSSGAAGSSAASGSTSRIRLAAEPPSHFGQTRIQNLPVGWRNHHALIVQECNEPSLELGFFVFEWF